MPITLQESLQLTADSWEPELFNSEEYSGYLESLAELQAESVWLRHAENLGWEEAYLESLLESGLISSY